VKSVASFGLAYAFVIAVGATATAQDTDADEKKMKAEDAAVVKACLDVAQARREAASTASSDDAPKKTGPEAHLDAAAREAAYAPESCIGIIAGPCMETPEGSSTSGMMACAGRELAVWDDRLNASYRKRLAPSADPAGNAASAAIEAKQLRKIQKAWIPWRDATCEVLYSDGIPIHGSSAQVNGVYCDMLLTARQALWMEGSSTIDFEN
jgi:uncharacterized protein YecT (DUF1311 family)